MTTDDQKEFDDRVIELVRQYGTITPNKLASVTKRKHETARASLVRLEEEGLIYSTKSGNRTYYTLMPGGKNIRCKPDVKRVENKSDGSGRVSYPPFQLRRANNRLEVIPERGFVCYPNVTGNEVSRKFIRTHLNGQYQVKIRQIGQFKTTDYIPDTDTRVYWKKNPLTTNIAMIGKIQMPNEIPPYAIRTVSDKRGKFTTLSIWPHARYIFYAGVQVTAELEFRQQVEDILSVLEKFGWTFKKETIGMIGNVHYAYNDVTLGSIIGSYNEKETDQVHYDRSHGTPEGETYSKDGSFTTDPDVVEIMVNLPSVVKSLATSVTTLTLVTKETSEQITMLQSQIISMLEVQSKLAEVITLPKQPTKNDFSNEGGMYQ